MSGIPGQGNVPVGSTVPLALAISEARLHALLEVAVDAIIGIDERGIIQLANPAAERLFGYSVRELVGANVSTLMPAPYRDEHDAYLARYRATGQKRIIGIGREVVGLRKDGTSFPLDLSVAEARLGEWRVFVGVIRDLSERKRTDVRFRQVVESMPNAIVMVNSEGAIVLVNSQAESYFGYSRGELAGQPVELLVPKRFRAAHPGYRARYFHSPSTRPMGSGRDLFGRRKDGSEFPVEIGLTPIHSAEGLHVLSSIVDISARKQSEEDLRNSHQELEKLVAELQIKNEEIRSATQQLWHAAKLASVGELAASIAHELNNPLATVSLRVESLLAATPAGDPRRRALEIVEQETGRMGNLVANLLQFSRRGVEEVTTVDVKEELNKTVELIHHVLRKRQINVVRELDPRTPTIFADRQKLRQVFLNLVSNASDAMPRGGTLTIRAAPTTLENGTPGVMLEFSDSGDGIPAELLGKIMEPFFTTKEEGKGTGLGLAICRRVVEEHHGAIQIISDVGRGTTVRLALPLKNGANAARIQGDVIGMKSR